MWRGLISILWVAAAGCHVVEEPLPPLAAAIVRDTRCTHDCAWLLTDGGTVELPTRGEVEIVVHANEPGLAAAATWSIVQGDRSAEVVAHDREDNAAGSDVTLAVPAVSLGEVVIEVSRDQTVSRLTCTVVDVLAGYGSTYSSSCTCAYCSKWCSTKDGSVVFSGTCC